jgi:hypothetical protein
MIILAHRGLWKSKKEQNTLVAFEHSFQNGFGIETDLRDFRGHLVISHDIATEDSLRLDKMLSCYKKIGHELTLAINIKSCGLEHLLKKMLNDFRVTNYFVFDLSVCELVKYRKIGVKFFARISELEGIPIFLEDAEGIWVDEFFGPWISESQVLKYLKRGRKVCFVSPELQKRAFKKTWSGYRRIWKLSGSHDLMVCTDHPQKARSYFNE